MAGRAAKAFSGIVMEISTLRASDGSSTKEANHMSIQLMGSVSS